jgi:glycogen operon protein
MAPDPVLAPGGWAEIRATIAALAEAGIEVILDVVLNHSGEGDAFGPTLSLRGLDNATYYRSLPGAPWRYADDTGCGNAIALDRPAPLRLAMDTLRTWAGQAGVHGFRFDLATTLGRRDDGFDPAAPLLSAIAQDPLLRDLKLIAEPWDVGPGGYRLGAFPAAWGEWNDRFRDGVRRFWRGDAGQLGELATRLAGSSDLFAARGVASRSVNFVVAHDGFTLADLVSYTNKINDANGEENRDGTDTNYSWNNGVDGPSDDPAIVATRMRDQRALMATLILARGTPMLAMGSEFGHSQGGNNNVYAQDNPAAWLDWGTVDAGLLAWTRHILRIRQEYELLRGDRFLTGEPVDISLFPDVEWRDAAGRVMTPDAWQAYDGNALVMTLAGPAETSDATDRLSVVLHRGQSDTLVVLPAPRAGYAWSLIANSAAESIHSTIISEPAITVAARGVLVLVERPREPNRR